MDGSVPIPFIALVVLGFAILVDYVRRVRAGRDPLGPQPPGDLPDTVVPLLVGVLGWLLIAALAGFFLSGSESLRRGGAAAEILLGTGMNLVVALALVEWAVRGTRRPLLPAWKLVAAGVCGGVVVFAAQYAIGHAIEVAYDVIHAEMPKQGIVEQAQMASGLDLVVFVVTAVVMAPFAEEVFFRGILLPAASRVVGERAAVVVQALVFGGIHFVDTPSALPLAIPLAVVGWFAGRLYVRTGSLAAPIALHVAFNAINFAALRTA
jgi:membrane protease YdiL (CAAX protease family)